MIEIKRFDALEFQMLSVIGKGYYPSEFERAELMMSEGILVSTPCSEWQKVGWLLTDAGVEYKKLFMKRLQEKHGHVWKTYKDTHDENDNDDVDAFAYSLGYHNGPECKNCGMSFCEHCDIEFDISPCSNRNLEKKD